MKLNTILALIVCMIVVAAGFYALTEYEGKDGVTDTKTYDDDNIEAVGNITSFNEAVNAFAFNFYKKFYNDPNNVDDIFLSPYSIFTALAMAYEGAEGLTAEEMASVLNIKQDNESFHEYMLSLYEHLNENTEYNISTANGLWQSLDYELLQ